MNEKDLKMLREILDKLPQKDVDFLRDNFGVPDASGIISIEHVKVCYWSADDVDDYCARHDIEEATEEQARAILDLVEDRFDASIGMNWDSFDDCCDDILKERKRK